MSVEELISELKAEFYKYDDAGLIDPASIYRWVEIAVKRFGGSVAVNAEAVIHSRNGQATLPQGFFDLIYAYRCEPWYCEYDKKMKPELQKEIGFVERTEHEFRWCSCDECCKEESEKIITEKLFINTPKEVHFHYHHPILLKLSKTMKRDKCAKDCRNRYVKDCPWEIMINGPIMYCNFDGSIYIKYREIPMEEDGAPIIPDTPLGLVAKYVETYVKKRLFEVVMVNGELQGAGDLFKVYAQQELLEFPSALRDAIMSQTSLKDIAENLKKSNKRKMAVYENMMPGRAKIFTKLV